MTSTWKRRATSLTLLACLALVAAPLLLALVPFFACFDLIARRRLASTRLAIFLAVLAWLEVAGLMGALWWWLLRPFTSEPQQFNGLYALQRWWARSILRLGTAVYRMDVQISGDPLTGKTMLLSRHAGLIDTVMPFALPS